MLGIGGWCLVAGGEEWAFEPSSMFVFHTLLPARPPFSLQILLEDFILVLFRLPEYNACVSALRWVAQMNDFFRI
jgi:hypothetical protein